MHSTPRRFRFVFAIVSGLALATRALAHPGHDDGHELIWELSHFAAHPIATLGCLALAAVATWTLWRVGRSAGQSFRGSQVSRGK